MEARGQASDGGPNFRGFHPENPIKPPQRIAAAPGRLPSPAPLIDFNGGPEQVRSEAGFEQARTAQANPAFKLRANHLKKSVVNERVRMQMMVGIDKTAFQTGRLK